MQWREMGFDTIFPYPAMAENPGMKRLAAEFGIKIFLTVPVYHAPEWLKTNQNLYARRADGTRASEEWLEFVCPSRAEYLARRMEEIENLMETTQPDGISLDFIRFFVFWEKVYPDTAFSSLPDTCFDAACLRDFSNATGIKPPGDLDTEEKRSSWVYREHQSEWIEWKCGVIAKTVKAVSNRIKKKKPDIKLNLHAVPWRSDDFDGAIKRIAGQDIGRMTAFADYVSPMCYSHMLKREPEWINSVVKDMAGKTDKSVIPCVQAGNMYIAEELTPAYFEASLWEASRRPSSGIIIWSWKALDKSPPKKDITKRFLSTYSNH